jgi:hypothetical protein
MIYKTYKILVSFGDGKPVESTIEAQNGILAQDKALAAHPGARSIRVVGVVSQRVEQPKVKIPILRPDLVVKPNADAAIHPLFTDVTVGAVKKFEIKDKEQKMKECLHLYNNGLSHKAIAKQLGVGKTTVGTWLKLLTN